MRPRHSLVADHQHDLFGDGHSPQPSVAGASRGDRPQRIARGVPGLPLEEMAGALEASGDYLVLRRLRPRPRVPFVRPPPAGTRIGVIVDVETTGLDHSKDEVIELGMVAFTYDGTGIVDVIDVFSALREPTVEISPEITRITGITPEVVAGRVIDLDAVSAFIEDADLMIAHHAGFDRTFCERLAPGFDYKPWACSVSEIDWASLGFEGAKLGYLVGQCGWFHQGHRAVDDCHALLEVLAHPSRTGATQAFAQLVASAERTRLRVWAEDSPYHAKDILKARGYRWSDGNDGSLKCWWIEIEEDAREDEIAFLHAEIYGMEADIRIERLTACERFRR